MTDPVSAGEGDERRMEPETLEQKLERARWERYEQDMEWARRYDDAVQPLQRRCGELVAQLEAQAAQAIEVVLTHNLPHGRDNALLNDIADRLRAALTGAPREPA